MKYSAASVLFFSALFLIVRGQEGPGGPQGGKVGGAAPQRPGPGAPGQGAGQPGGQPGPQGAPKGGPPQQYGQPQYQQPSGYAPQAPVQAPPTYVVNQQSEGPDTSGLLGGIFEGIYDFGRGFIG